MTHTEQAMVVATDLQPQSIVQVGSAAPPQLAVVTLQIVSNGVRFTLANVSLDEMSLFVLGSTVQIDISQPSTASSASSGSSSASASTASTS